MALIALTVLIAAFLFGKTFLKGELDLHFHDTYFVISPWLILTPLFLLLTFITYFIKENRNSFKRTLSNWLLAVVGVTLIVMLTFLIQTFSQFLIGGWTSYPPLSALGVADNLSDQTISELTLDPVAKFITSFLTIIQSIILILLLYFVFRWGTQRHTNRNG